MKPVLLHGQKENLHKKIFLMTMRPIMLHGPLIANTANTSMKGYWVLPWPLLLRNWLLLKMR